MKTTTKFRKCLWMALCACAFIACTDEDAGYPGGDRIYDGGESREAKAATDVDGDRSGFTRPDEEMRVTAGDSEEGDEAGSSPSDIGGDEEIAESKERGEGPEGEADVFPDGDLDHDPDECLEIEIEPDAATNTCAPGILTNVTLELDPAGPDTQIHAAAAFDGNAVWVAYNIPDALGGFDVYALRLCGDGTVLVPPFKVNSTDFNDVDPDLAVGNDKLYVVWLSDNSSGLRNLDIYYRVYTIDGGPLMASDRRLSTTRGGQAADYNAWMPQAAVLPGGAFAVAGAWGLEEAGRFQVFIQRIGANGDLIGEAIDGCFEAGVAQLYPDLAAAGDGTLYLGWTRSPDDGAEHVVHTRLAPEDTEPEPPVEAVAAQSGSGAALAPSRGESVRVYLAFHTEGGANVDVLLKDAARPGVETPVLRFGTSTEIDHSPAVAAGPDGGAVVWHRLIRGFENDVLVQRFNDNGQVLEKSGEPVRLNGDVAPPYAPAVTHISGHIYFIAWSEGKSPDFRLKGRFVNLE